MALEIFSKVFSFRLLERSSDSTESSPHTAIRSSTSRAVHAGALYLFSGDCMVTCADELCVVTCADESSTLAKQEMQFKSSLGFSCIPGQCSRVQLPVQSSHWCTVGYCPEANNFDLRPH
uniref:Uncharacterized protein n=1 Tax=Gopherus agassizii TaxID=38772 RepID=A0A452IDB8_9SAUR